MKAMFSAMPSNQDMERAILGVVISDPDAAAEIVPLMEDTDFYVPSHGKAFRVVAAMFYAGAQIDALSVDAKLRQERIDKPTAFDLCGMADGAILSVVRNYVPQLKKLAQARAIIGMCRQTAEQLGGMADEPAVIGASLASQLLSVCEDHRRGFEPIGDVVTRVVKQMDEASDAGDFFKSVPTGLADVDAKLGGLHQGQLVVVAGRPSMGKTAFGITVARNAAAAGRPVAVVSCESPLESIVLRLLSRQSGVENRNLRRGSVDLFQASALVEAAGVLSGLPISAMDKQRSWDAITAAIRALKMRQPELAMVVLDYVGLLQISWGHKRHEEIGRISGEAKALAVELDLAFVALVQINREPESRNDKRPLLSDLRDSGSLEQDPDVVGLLFRPVYYDPAFCPRDLAELNIAKNRDGPTGVIRVKFDEQTVSFRDWQGA